MNRSLAGAGLAILLSSLLPGQSKSTFEVADIHVSPPGARRGDGGFMPGGRVELHGITMLDLISMAYEVDSENVVGGPPWLNTDRFEIIAKARPGTTEETIPAMLKTLLEDRVKLAAHRDKKDLPVFILTARKGIKLTPAADAGPPSTSRGEGDPALNNHLKCTSYTMPALAELLPQVAANFVSHPVVDDTHLKGAFDFQLDWMGIAIYRKAKANPEGPPAVGAFDAVEKLGLHLEPGTRPGVVIVVDNVNRIPTPNPEGATPKIPAFPTEFEVAEVRPTRLLSVPAQPLGPMGRVDFENGRVEIMSATFQGLLSLAFDVDPRFLVGGAKWMEEDRFDVIAKTTPTVPFETVRSMLKSLLIERFKLATHSEVQPALVYVLQAGKKPKLKESAGTARSDCKIVNTDRRYFVCENITMAQFVERLPGVSGAYIHPPVLDLTGLSGAYDFQLYWTPKRALSNAGGTTPSDAAPTPVDEVTVFEAVDKQLGLKLEEQKHPVPVVVIDSAERKPSEK